MRLISRSLRVLAPPIAAAQRLLQEYRGDLDLIDLSQGVPNYPTAPEIAARVGEVATSPAGGRYTERAGITGLREAIAQEAMVSYNAAITPDNVLVTAGCNQAFCMAVSTLADVQDQVILPTPFYFNHDMWLKLDGITPIYLETAPSFIPDPRLAAKLISDRTRAIVLVTPGNPTGAIIPDDVLSAFGELARRHDLALIIDETYRSFRGVDRAPHSLLATDAWENNIITLHSYSKEFAIPGYRVGCVMAAPALISEMMKFFDCISICAPRLGQEAVLEGLLRCHKWRSERIAEIRAKAQKFREEFCDAPGGFSLASAGAFFAWVKHPCDHMSTSEVVIKLIEHAGIVAVPGSVFTPGDDGFLRFSFANSSLEQIAEVSRRLKRVRL
jgi:aspartate/methionine/tyrosine aminotransferase